MEGIFAVRECAQDIAGVLAAQVDVLCSSVDCISDELNA